MNTLSNLLSASLTAFLILGCGGEKQTDMNEDIASITAMSKARADAFNEGNAAEIARYFADDAFLMAPGKVSQRGKEAVEAYYQSIFEEFETVLESGYEDVVVDGDLAYGRGFAKVTLTPKNGGEKTYATSKYLNILERQEDGTWITTHDIWNGNEE
ncbi:YybH family protein [Lunatibacter salilacus]|uniref:YybH family protein n=1 Tax=Lunatibacter salilacus TaxID=2483804 RepID=UPI00131E0522|nr:SgcJ/EcaC family oxidoreductase [Lunatibacter salilacus]